MPLAASHGLLFAPPGLSGRGHFKTRADDRPAPALQPFLCPHSLVHRGQNKGMGTEESQEKHCLNNEEEGTPQRTHSESVLPNNLPPKSRRLGDNDRVPSKRADSKWGQKNESISCPNLLSAKSSKVTPCSTSRPQRFICSAVSLHSASPKTVSFGNELQKTPIPCSSTRTFTIAAPVAVLPQG